MFFTLSGIILIIGLALLASSIDNKVGAMGLLVTIIGAFMYIGTGNKIKLTTKQKPNKVVLDTLSTQNIHIAAYKIDTTIYTKITGDSINKENVRIIKKYNNLNKLAETKLKLK
jgi:hypothetical protein